MCSKQPTDGCSPTIPEAELYRCLQALLAKEGDAQLGQGSDNHGMLRWTLHKKVKNNPINSLSLVWVLVRELEKAERCDSRGCIIPLLHTLMYAICETAYLPDELYKRIYDFCKKLLTFPHPYSSVSLSYTRKIKSERFTPGLMYQRMITAEQGLKNVHYLFRERVFVLADLEVFSHGLMHVLSEDLNASASASVEYLSPFDHMRNSVLHAIQAALGPEQCNGLKLAQALKDMAHDIEPLFQEVMGILEHSAKGGSRGDCATLRSRLLLLYNKIVAEAQSGAPLSAGALSDCPLPNPEMSVHLWTEDLDIWRELAKWLHPSSYSEQFSFNQEDFELEQSTTDQTPSALTRYSVTSIDSGIERDLPPSSDPSQSPTSSLDAASISASWEENKSEQVSRRLSRQGGIKVKPTVQHSMVLMQDSFDGQVHQGGKGGSLQSRTGSNFLQSSSKQKRCYTAKIVAMGDDRILGKLARAYHLFRKKEARRLFLTTKVNIQFYYIPVRSSPTRIPSLRDNVDPCETVPCSVGSYLSVVDPWYNDNIKSLGAMIPKLAKINPGQQKDPFISDIISYYVRWAQQPVLFTIYSVKVTFINTKIEHAEDVFVTHLEVDFPEFRLRSGTLKADKRRRSSGEICGSVVSINYKQVTFGCRNTDRGLSVRTTGLQIHAVPFSEVEDLNCLTLTLNETPAKTKTNVSESKVLTRNMKIHSYESRPMTVTLDRDNHQSYKGVQSIEISPCMDPGYCIQKAMRTKLNLHNDSGLSKYMSQGLQLPINTFSGIIN